MPPKPKQIFLYLLIIFSISKVLLCQGSVSSNNEEEILRLIQTIKTESSKKNDKDKDTIKNSIDELADYNEQAIPFLIKTLTPDNNQNSDFLGSIADTFEKINLKSSNENLIPDLIKVLKETPKSHENKTVIRFIINSLKNVLPNNPNNPKAKEAIPYLLEILELKKLDETKNYDKEYYEEYDAAADCLQAMGKNAKETVPFLIETLKFEKVRTGSYYSKINAIKKIIDDLQNAEDFTENDKIISAFEKYKKDISTSNRKEIEVAIQNLNSKRAEQVSQRNKQIYGIIIFIFIFIILFVFLYNYLFKPIKLVIFHEYIWTKSLTPNFKSILEFPIFSIVSWVCLTPKSLDAWVISNLANLKGNFEEKETVKERTLYVPVKIQFKGKNLDFTAKNFREVFDKNQERLLIYGDGGSGKTSLVCQMAQWAINKRLFEKHNALPILVENDTKDIQKTISEEIKILTDNENKISDALQKALLRKKRILLIADGLSEFNDETKLQIINNADINAVVYTSRNNEIKDISKIETNSVTDESIYNFISTYIKKRLGKIKKENLFPNDEIHIYCANLSKLVGEKGISVLLAKLYAEQMIAQKQGTLKEDLPDNVPDLMIKSIEVLHKKEIYKNIEFSEVIKISKIIAWECVSKDYRPLSVDKDKVINTLEHIAGSKELLKHLRDNLKIIEEKGIEANQISYKLDPLAEYLAAIYLIQQKATDKKDWNVFLKDAKQKNKNGEIKGFLVAIEDYCEQVKLVDKAKEINKLI